MKRLSDIKISKQLDMQTASQNVDRISGLPEPLLHHILSFLPTSKNVVQTCLLSKTWIDVWCSAPSINFHMDRQDLVGFFKFADCVLLHRTGRNVHSFRLRISYWRPGLSTSVYITGISSWIIYALRHNVQVLDVESFTLSFIIPSCVFMSPFLKELRLDLTYGLLKLPNSVCLPSLEILVLKRLKVEDADKLSAMLASCLSLHAFSISDCVFDGNSSLTMSTPRLRTFSFKGWLDYTPPLKIFVPCLVSLSVDSWTLTLSIDDCPSLVDANITIMNTSSESMEQLIRALSKVESLKICQNFIQACVNVGEGEDEYEPYVNNWIQTPFYRLRFLKLRTDFSKGHHKVINTLLSSSPNIETFILEHAENEAWNGGLTEDEESEPESSGHEACEAESKGKVASKEKLSHLKIVKFQNFGGSQNEVKFVKFFFRKATSLEKLVLMAPKSNQGSPKKKVLADMTKILLKYSQDTKICIDERSASVSSFCLIKGIHAVPGDLFD